jgi:fermentation-respiration switch protein FrsA (DUF1100 family)
VTRLLRRIALVAVVLYLAILAGLFLGQRSLLYPGSDRQTTVAEAGLEGFEDVIVVTADGEHVVGWWKPPQPGRALLLYFHGNGGSLWNRRHRAKALTESGRGLLMVSYRGYSGSTGTPTEDGLRLDARAAYGWVTRDYDPARVVAYGESLGTGVVVRLAVDRRLGGVILDAPYTSTADVASLAYPFVPVAWLMRDQYRSLDIIGDLKTPLLMMHGTADRIIPFALGERLFAAAPEPKRFVRFEGIGHTTLLESGGLAAVDAFLAEIEKGLVQP